MEKQQLKHIITTHKEHFFASDKLSSRLIPLEDERKLLSKEIVTITGIRRSGKSSLLRLYYHFLHKKRKINKNNILFINFEDERLINFDVNDFETLHQCYIELYAPKGRTYYFLDEIQNIPNWERWVNRLYEFNDVKIFVTGSNASLLQSEISNSLTGRHRQIMNYCFSFPEYAILKNTSLRKKDLYSDIKRIKINRLLENYITLGGFPEVLKHSDITLIDQYFKDIIYRDIIARNRIRNIKEIRELAIYLISNTGNLNSYENLRKIIGATNTMTIKNYMGILEDAYIIHSLSLFDYSIKKQIYNSNKYYVTDVGFYHAVGFSFTEDRGRILENLVLLDLLRSNLKIHYWKSKKGHEVDFVIQEKNSIEYAIQVCYHLTNENLEREARSLLEAKEEIDAKQLIIITMEQNKVIQYKNVQIKTISYLNWLLEDTE